MYDRSLMAGSPLCTTEEAAQYLNLSERTLRLWRVKKKGPRYIKLGNRVRYDQESLDEFIKASEVDHG